MYESDVIGWDFWKTNDATGAVPVSWGTSSHPCTEREPVPGLTNEVRAVPSCMPESSTLMNEEETDELIRRCPVRDGQFFRKNR